MTSPLLEDNNTAAETKSYYLKSSSEKRKDETATYEDYKPCIKDFELDQIVGAGAFAKVHKAYNKKNEEWVALKVVKKESVAAMKHVDHILNERNVLRFITQAQVPEQAEDGTE